MLMDQELLAVSLRHPPHRRHQPFHPYRSVWYVPDQDMDYTILEYLGLKGLNLIYKDNMDIIN